MLSHEGLVEVKFLFKCNQETSDGKTSCHL